jgi:hypothetical protein
VPEDRRGRQDEAIPLHIDHYGLAIYAWKSILGSINTRRDRDGRATGLANVLEQPTLLDLGKPSPNATFTAVVYGENRAKFGTLETSLRGKRICVTGKISNYQGKPEIVLTDPSQLSQ